MRLFGILLPLVFAIFLILIGISIVTRRVPPTLYLPEFPLATRPIGYFLSLIYMALLAAVTFLGSIEYTFGIRILPAS